MIPRFYRNFSAFILLLLLGGNRADAQVFGGNPPSQKWLQINTPLVKVIYPAGLDSVAGRIASIIEATDTKTGPTLGSAHRKISIVLQNKTNISNAYVGLAPWRSEFYMMPIQNSFELGSLPFHEGLALHEYRHVQQYAHFNKGLTKFMSILAGEQGLDLASNAAVPDWFWEGDAVYQESITSRQGRGRLPNFFNGYRSLWKDGRKYSWMKLRNGSFRDFVPDHYQLGYLLVAYGRQQYGDSVWAGITEDAVRYRGLFYPFQQAVKRRLGISFTEFTGRALDYFKTRSTKPGDGKNIPRHYTTDEIHPQFTESGSIIYLKKDFRHLPRFVRRTKKGDQLIRVRDLALDDYFSLKNGKIVYAAYEPDARWGNQNYNVLRVLDLATGKQKRLGNKTRLFSPDISGDGKKIVAVDMQADGHSQLVFMDAETGAEAGRVNNPDKVVYSYPKFTEFGTLVAILRYPDGKMALAIVDAATGRNTLLTPATYHVLGFPNVDGGYVYFSASGGKVDNIYTADMKKPGRLFKLKESEAGRYQADFLEGRLVFNEFTSSGQHFRELRGKELWEYVPEDEFTDPPMLYLQQDALKAERLQVLGTQLPEQKLPSKKYRQSAGFFNFHSWRPTYTDPDITFSVLGNNVLNTTSSELFYSFNQNERTHTTGYNFTWGGWFPQLTAGVNYVANRNFSDSGRTRTWNELNAVAGVSVPLNLSRNRHITGLNMGVNYVVDQLYYTGVSKDVFSNKALTYIQPFIRFVHQSQRARMQIYPRWSQSLSLNYRSALSQFSANQLLANGSLFVPGLAPTHSLFFGFSYQRRDTLRQHFFSNNFPFARGYSTIVNSPRMWRVAANYTLPLIYPDWGFGNILYFLRVRGNMFYDHTQVYFGQTLKNTRRFRSAGAEVFVDTRWWNQFPVSLGLRYSRLLNPPLVPGAGRNQFEVILPVDLF